MVLFLSCVPVEQSLNRKKRWPAGKHKPVKAQIQIWTVLRDALTVGFLCICMTRPGGLNKGSTASSPV